MTLSNVVRGKESRPRMCTLYGTQGIGKSTFGASAPGSIFLPTEDGLADIDCARFPLLRSVPEVLDAISSLYTEDHEFRSVVVDSLDWLEPLIWQHVVETHGAARGCKSIEDFGYGKGYLLATDTWRQIIEGLAALRRDRKMHIILLAHAMIQRFEDPTTASYDRYMPRLHKGAAALVQEACDEVLFARYRVYVREEAKGFGGKAAKGAGHGERIVCTEERPSHAAKNRLSLPYEMPLSWASYAEHFNK